MLFRSIHSSTSASGWLSPNDSNRLAESSRLIFLRVLANIVLLRDLLVAESSALSQAALVAADRIMQHRDSQRINWLVAIGASATAHRANYWPSRRGAGNSGRRVYWPDRTSAAPCHLDAAQLFGSSFLFW